MNKMMIATIIAFVLVFISGLLIGGGIHKCPDCNLNYNLTCPKPKCPKIECPKSQVKLTPNYIQNAHHNINYTLEGDDFIISNIDNYGKIDGYSMQPTIFDGDTVIDVKYEGQELKEGMIVRYLDKDNGPMVHRIKGVYKDRVIMQGDANRYHDGYINKTQITHLVVGVLYT